MQSLRSHSRFTELESLFSHNCQVIYMPIKAWEHAEQMFRLDAQEK